MRINCRMETGIGKRVIEDCILIDNSILAGGVFSTTIPHGTPFSVAIADGVGGNNAGNWASHIAAEGLLSMKLRAVDNESALEAQIKQINAQIVERSLQEKQLDKMATTLSGLYFSGEKWFLFHVGNSRVYLLDTPYLKQITTDHTWAYEMLRAGLTEEEIENSGKSSTITSCLGNGNIATASKLQIMDVSDLVFASKCIYLTSDGIHDFIPHQMLERGVTSGVSTDELIRLCMELARERGSIDDLSMMCLSFDDSSNENQ